MFIKRLTVGKIGTNCYILCDTITGSAAVLDPGFDAPRILQALKDTHCTAEYVILTHGHGDHMSAAGDVLAGTGAKLAVIEEETGFLNDPAMNLFSAFEGETSAPFEPFTPDLLLHDGETFELGSLELKAVSTPGHTPDSCCILCQDNLFSGDTLFRDSAGRTDLPGGNAAALSASLKKLAVLPGEYNVLPGHGEFTMMSREKQFNPFLIPEQ